MKTLKSKSPLRALVVAIQTALVIAGSANAALAQDQADPARALTERTNYVEIGAGYINHDSYKFGEYNGLQDEGVFGLLNFLLRGGGAYDSDSATRWSVVGSSLGLDTRELKAEYGQQGKFRLSFGYDELTHNVSDSYQTPYQGVGTNVLTLPSNWLQPRVPQVNATSLNFRGLLPGVSTGPALINGVLVQPTTAQLAELSNIVANDASAFRNGYLDTKRERTRAGFSYQISPEWGIKVSAENEDKNGLRGQNTVTSLVREFAAVIPELVDQTTQQYNVSVNYVAERAHVEVAYYGSIYDNNVKSMTWGDVNDLTKSSTMATAPSNEFHQFNVTGGYRFAPQTNLVFNAGYARGTQNDTFLNDPQLPLGIPVTSLDGLVITKSFNAKLTMRPAQDFNFVAAYKYDDRDNQTPVETYIFQDANEARGTAASPFNAVLGLAPNTLGSNINIYANRPYSKKLNQLDLAADYAITDGQILKATYQYQKVERDCGDSWINCADAPKTTENTGQLEWRVNATESLTGSLSYTYSERSVNYDENAFLALVPMANFIPAGGATVSVLDYLRSTGLTGWGPYLGYPTVPLTGNAAIYSPNNNIVPQSLYGSRNNVAELIGMRRFNMADRNRDKVRAKFDLQASESLSLYGSVDYEQDDYNHSLYGLTNAENWAVNLDAGYSISESATFNVFYTYEERQAESAGSAYGSNSNTAFVGVAANTVVSGGCYDTVQARNNNAHIDSCLDWTSDSRDRINTFGFGLKFTDLMDGRLSLDSDLTGSRARTRVNVSGGSYTNNPFAVSTLPPVNPAVYFISAQNLPTVTTNTIELHLNAGWKLNDASELRMYYWYAHMKASDYMYDGLQTGSLAIVMPTNEQAPSYNINGIGLAYAYRW